MSLVCFASGFVVLLTEVMSTGKMIKYNETQITVQNGFKIMLSYREYS